jgi:hypothetical protein
MRRRPAVKNLKFAFQVFQFKEKVFYQESQLPQSPRGCSPKSNFAAYTPNGCRRQVSSAIPISCDGGTGPSDKRIFGCFAFVRLEQLVENTAWNNDLSSEGRTYSSLLQLPRTAASRHIEFRRFFALPAKPHLLRGPPVPGLEPTAEPAEWRKGTDHSRMPRRYWILD